MSFLAINQIIELCELQGSIFVNSLKLDVSSKQFIKSFLKSDLIKPFDDGSYFYTTIDGYNLENKIKILGKKSRVVKYSEKEMYWIGYLLRYWSLSKEINSSQLCGLVDPDYLRSVYLPYHTVDIEKALQMILKSDKIKKPLTVKEAFLLVSRDTKKK